MNEGTSVKISVYRFQSGATFSPKTGRYTKLFKNAAIFSKFVMVPRPLALARAKRSRTCADVIQPVAVAIYCLGEVGGGRVTWFSVRKKENRSLYQVAVKLF